MRVLTDVKPTPEQLKVLGDYQPGFTLIRGAAGSGKTTTAVLRLRFVSGVWASQRARKRATSPVKALVLTYNRTLKGYVETLVKQQIGADVDLTISTFAKWAKDALGITEMLSGRRRHAKLWALGSGLGYESRSRAGSAGKLSDLCPGGGPLSRIRGARGLLADLRANR